MNPTSDKTPLIIVVAGAKGHLGKAYSFLRS